MATMFNISVYDQGVAEYTGKLVEQTDDHFLVKLKRERSSKRFTRQIRLSDCAWWSVNGKIVTYGVREEVVIVAVTSKSLPKAEKNGFHSVKDDKTGEKFYYPSGCRAEVETEAT